MSNIMVVVENKEQIQVLSKFNFKENNIKILPLTAEATFYLNELRFCVSSMIDRVDKIKGESSTIIIVNLVLFISLVAMLRATSLVLVVCVRI